jgi:hypothetical protein
MIFTHNLIRTLILSGIFFECVPTTRRRINLPEGKLGRGWNARKIISGYELMLECRFGKKIVTTQTLKRRNPFLNCVIL